MYYILYQLWLTMINLIEYNYFSYNKPVARIKVFNQQVDWNGLKSYIFVSMTQTIWFVLTDFSPYDENFPNFPYVSVIINSLHQHIKYIPSCIKNSVIMILQSLYTPEMHICLSNERLNYKMKSGVINTLMQRNIFLAKYACYDKHL